LQSWPKQPAEQAAFAEGYMRSGRGTKRAAGGAGEVGPPQASGMNPEASLRKGPEMFTDDELSRIEREHGDGVTSEQIVDFFTRRHFKFTEATLRKYVQLGLLPRSRRVAIRGAQRGSQGLYPATVIRRIQHLKSMLVHYSIDQIQKEFLFVRGDIEELEQSLERVFQALASAVKPREDVHEAQSRAVLRELTEAKALAAELMAKLSSVETRLTMRAKLESQARKDVG
jgi:DNA-binding transcriptional MerR regulator